MCSSCNWISDHVGCQLPAGNYACIGPPTARHSLAVLPPLRLPPAPDDAESREPAVLAQRGPSRYWISSSARASTDCGTASPSALAVLRLMISSNFVGCSMARSAGLAPLRILST